jgi:predicted Zn-dependent protease
MNRWVATGALLGLFALGFGQQPPVSDSQTQTQKQIQAEKQHEADVQSDVEEGKKAAEDTEKQVKLSTNADYQARVQRIGADIAAVADSYHAKALWGDQRFNKFNYTYKVIQGDDVNAFSLPGGHIYVYEGLMKQVESDDELAGVLAHETAHAAFRHVAQLEKDQQKMMNISLPAILAAILLGRGGGANVGIPGVQLLGQAMMNGWSVKAEEAADYGGLQYMMKSHYDPSGMLTFMERLAVDEKIGLNYNWGIYRDHPPGKERAESLIHYMEEAGVPVRRSHVTTSFRVSVRPGEGGAVQLFFGNKSLVALGGNDALKRADEAAVTLNRFFDATPEMFELQEGPDGKLLWKSMTLIQLEPCDANLKGDRLENLEDSTLQNMRTALFNLGFHVWESHE